MRYYVYANHQLSYYNTIEDIGEKRPPKGFLAKKLCLDHKVFTILSMLI